MKLQKNLEHLKDLQVLKLTLNYQKNGIVKLKTLSETTICKAGGYGYDKQGTVLKELFLKLGFNVKNICYTKFDLFHYSIEAANEFLKINNINYKINYRSSINNSIDFLELEKI